MASGLSIGLAMGVGGVAAVVLGAVADAIDLKTALTICAVAPALGVIGCLRLPAPAKQARQRPVPAGTLEPTAYAPE
jgi:FSR family fosmidomycin resistance protein-like MFS transporter